MPITGPASYVPTTAEFAAHWGDVNTALGAGNELVLEDGMAILEFVTLRSALLTARDDLEGADLEVGLARAALQMAKEGILAKLNLFNTLVRGTMSSSVYARVLPLVPGIGEGQEGFSQPMVQGGKLWGKINATPPGGVTPPVLLVDGTTQAQFAAAMLGLGVLYGEVVDAEQDFALALQRREDLQDLLYTAMKLYRQAVPAKFLPGEALVEAMPVLTAQGGRTPDAVALSGVWNAVDAAAHLTAGVSSDPELKEYELRWCAGGSYSQVTEHTAGSIPAGSPPVFVTTKGLTVAGAVASFRVYVRLLSGGEAGSETVVITRP